MRPLKFCMVTTFYPPYNFGGDGIFVYRLANALARDGHKVHIIHDADAYTLFDKEPPSFSVSNHPNITLQTLRGDHFQNLDLLLSHQLGKPLAKQQILQKSLEENDFDIIHFHNISLIGGPGLLHYGKGLKLCTLHDHWFVCTMHVLWRLDREVCQQRSCLRCTLAGHRPPQLWRYTNAVAEAASHIDAFIAPSQFACKSHELNGFPAPIQQLSHFLSTVDEPLPNSLAAEEARPRPYFLFVGRLEKIKGVQTLLEAFEKYRSADLLIAGSGGHEDDLRQMAKNLPHVRFLGYLQSQQLKNLYRKAIAVIVPSLCYETFGLVPIEAFSVKTPAIVRNLGALPETIQDGGGIAYDTLEELLQAMQRLQHNLEYRRKLSAEAYKIFQSKYTEEKHLNSYYSLIEKLQKVLEAKAIRVTA